MGCGRSAATVWYGRPATQCRNGDETNQKGMVATGIAAALSGNGYYLVFSDRGVFSFSDAVFYGSAGGQ
jgi:hypothetical protein